MTYTLLCPFGFRSQKILIAAKIANVSITHPSFQMGKDNKTKEFTEKNPFNKVPVLDTCHGPIYESNAILRFIARHSPISGLYGNSDYEKSLIDQWLDCVSGELEVVRGVWLYTVLGGLPYNAKAHSEAKKECLEVLKKLDAHFLHTTYIAKGQTITIADLALFCALVDWVY